MVGSVADVAVDAVNLRLVEMINPADEADVNDDDISEASGLDRIKGWKIILNPENLPRILENLGRIFWKCCLYQ